MTALEVATVADPEQIVAVAQQVFSALVDDGEVLVFERGPAPVPADVVRAWVDMTRAGEARGIRTSVRMDAAGAELLVRSLLRMGESEAVTAEDLADAFGEIANVVGGNLKSLLPEQAVLSLPTVAVADAAADAVGAPGVEGTELAVVTLDWRGHVLVISLADVCVG